MAKPKTKTARKPKTGGTKKKAPTKLAVPNLHTKQEGGFLPFLLGSLIPMLFGGKGIKNKDDIAKKLVLPERETLLYSLKDVVSPTELKKAKKFLLGKTVKPKQNGGLLYLRNQKGGCGCKD